MCEIFKRDGSPCPKPATHHCHIKGYVLSPTEHGRVYGDPLMGTKPEFPQRPVHVPDGLSLSCCRGHLGAAIESLDIFRGAATPVYGAFSAAITALVTVAPYSSIPRLRTWEH